MSTSHGSDPGITPDEPYRPSFADPTDTAEALAASRPGSRGPIDPASMPEWAPPQGTSGKSLLPPPDHELQSRLQAAEAKLDRGEDLTPEELEYLVSRSAVRLLGSRRPGTVASGLKALQAVQNDGRRRAQAKRSRW